MSSSKQVSRLSRLEKTLIDLWCRDAPCAVHTAFEAERSPKAEDATGSRFRCGFLRHLSRSLLPGPFLPPGRNADVRYGHSASDKNAVKAA